MRIFEFDDYREYIVHRVKSMPAGGRGEYQKIAGALRMHTTAVSQIFSNRSKNLTLEQACALAEYFGFSTLESDYLLALVQKERAGSKKLRMQFARQCEQLNERAQQLSARVPQDFTLSDETKATFYSAWYYSAIRLMTSVPDFQTIDSLAQRFDLSRQRVSEVMGFLISCGLCVEENGRFKMGPQSTHVPGGTTLATRHQINWRLRMMPQLDRVSPTDELVYSAPMTLSKTACLEIRKIFLEAIEKTTKIVAESPSEDLYCLNLDWCRVR